MKTETLKYKSFRKMKSDEMKLWLKQWATMRADTKINETIPQKILAR